MRGIGERLKLLRNEKEMSLDELGAILNMPKSSLSRYENNESDPSIEAVKKIASYFKVSIDWLAGLSDERDLQKYDTDMMYQDILVECKKSNISTEKLLKMINLLKGE